MSKFRCKECEHTPRRVVTATMKTGGGSKIATPKLHKKPCECECHRQVAA